MSQVVVLGAGMVGRAIAKDLAGRHKVCSADRDPAALSLLREHGIEGIQADLNDSAQVSKAIGSADLVICAVPGFMGFRTLQTVIEAGRSVVDISFMPENALELDELATERGVTAIVDMGVAPGMDNLLFGFHDVGMKVEHFECLVGGLPVARHYPFEYKAPFSPIDVIEEYTRPARFVEGGRQVTRPALSEPELVEFEELGTLEAFNSDGLRSLLETMPHVPDMKEKTLRYPGHRDLMAALAASGFFSEETIRVGDKQVRAIDATSAILLEAWRLQPDEPELTVMRVTIEGDEQGEQVRYVYDLHDRYDETSGTSSMARTTGYACNAAAQLILEGSFTRLGVSAPEIVGRQPGCCDQILGYLRERAVNYRLSRKVLSAS